MADISSTREARAARNQVLFRTVNEKLWEINQTFVEVVGPYAIACECADLECVETVQISPDEYRSVRENPRHFVVVRGHVYPEVQRLVRESDGYAVVEKERLAAQLAERDAALQGEGD